MDTHVIDPLEHGIIKTVCWWHCSLISVNMECRHCHTATCQRAPSIFRFPGTISLQVSARPAHPWMAARKPLLIFTYDHHLISSFRTTPACGCGAAIVYFWLILAFLPHSCVGEGLLHKRSHVHYMKNHILCVLGENIDDLIWLFSCGPGIRCIERTAQLPAGGIAAVVCLRSQSSPALDSRVLCGLPIYCVCQCTSSSSRVTGILSWLFRTPKSKKVVSNFP